MECKKHQGKIYLLYDTIPEEPRLEAKTAGTAKKIGLRGPIGG